MAKVTVQSQDGNCSDGSCEKPDPITLSGNITCGDGCFVVENGGTVLGYSVDDADWRIEAGTVYVARAGCDADLIFVQGSLTPEQIQACICGSAVDVVTEDDCWDFILPANTPCIERATKAGTAISVDAPAGGWTSQNYSPAMFDALTNAGCSIQGILWLSDRIQIRGVDAGDIRLHECPPVEVCSPPTTNVSNCGSADGSSVTIQQSSSASAGSTLVSGSWRIEDSSNQIVASGSHSPSDLSQSFISISPASQLSAGSYVYYQSVEDDCEAGNRSSEASCGFAVSSTTPNQSPIKVSAIPDFTFTEGQTITPINGAVFSDPDGDSLLYSMNGNPGGIVINSSTGQIMGLIANNAADNSPYATQVNVSDGKGGIASCPFTITVIEDPEGCTQPTTQVTACGTADGTSLTFVQNSSPSGQQYSLIGGTWRVKDSSDAIVRDGGHSAFTLSQSTNTISMSPPLPPGDYTYCQNVTDNCQAFNVSEESECAFSVPAGSCPPPSLEVTQCPQSTAAGQTASFELTVTNAGSGDPASLSSVTYEVRNSANQIVSSGDLTNQIANTSPDTFSVGLSSATTSSMTGNHTISFQVEYDCGGSTLSLSTNCSFAIVNSAPCQPPTANLVSCNLVDTNSDNREDRVDITYTGSPSSGSNLTGGQIQLRRQIDQSIIITSPITAGNASGGTVQFNLESSIFDGMDGETIEVLLTVEDDCTVGNSSSTVTKTFDMPPEIVPKSCVVNGITLLSKDIDETFVDIDIDTSGVGDCYIYVLGTTSVPNNQQVFANETPQNNGLLYNGQTQFTIPLNIIDGEISVVVSTESSFNGQGVLCSMQRKVQTFNYHEPGDPDQTAVSPIGRTYQVSPGVTSEVIDTQETATSEFELRNPWNPFAPFIFNSDTWTWCVLTDLTEPDLPNQELDPQ